MYIHTYTYVYIQIVYVIYKDIKRERVPDRQSTTSI